MFEKILHLLVCHALGDFWLQSAYLTEMKATRFYHLGIHSLLYTTPFLVLFPLSYQHMVVFLAHFATDALKARYGRLTFNQDQILHYLTLLIFLLP